MTTVHVSKSKLIIRTDSPLQSEMIESAIGSAHIAEGDTRLVRCKTSTFNLRRVRELSGGKATLEKNDETRQEVDALLKHEETWKYENLLIEKVKKGKVFDTEDYAFKFTPYKHQNVGFHFMRACKRGAIFGDCGIGKTAIVASFLDYLVHTGQVDEENPALIVCPISIIYQAWIKDTEKFTSIKPVSIYEPSSYRAKQKREKRLSTPSPVYIASFSLLQIMEKELRKKKFKFIAIDESSKIKNPQAKTFKALLNVSWKSEWRYVMSGTPAPNGPIDLWSQFFFLDDGMTLEPSLVDFRNEYYKQIAVPGRGAHVGFWVPKRGIEPKINKQIEKRSVRFKSNECLDLPPRTFMVRELRMTKEQQKVYDEMSENLFTEMDGSSITARVAVSKLMKLREITGGFVIDDNRDEKPFKTNPKIDELDSLLEDAIGDGTSKALVWAQYRWEIQTLLSRYRKKYGAKGLYGDISQPEKDKNVDDFLDSHSCRLLVCHPKSAAHGLTLTSASYSIYYSLSHDFEEYYQSSMRIHRPGQKRPTFYYFLTAKGSIDESLLKCIQNKKNVQDILVDGAIDLSGFLGIRK